jgi:hypothetical protein
MKVKKMLSMVCLRLLQRPVFPLARLECEALVAVGVVVSSLAVSCGPGSAGGGDRPQADSSAMQAPAGPSISLQARAQGRLAIVYFPGEVPARMAELWLKLPEGYSFRGAEPGGAAVDAGKNVVAQGKSDNTVRVIAFSSEGIDPLGAGDIAVLDIDREPGAVGEVRLLTDRPFLAPREAQNGLMINEAAQF